MEQHPKVSVIVVHYGPDKLLQGCLASLKAQTFRDFEVIVVDNNKDNRGFAAGANEGIRKAKGEYIALINNDARAEPLWLQTLVYVADRQPHGMFASKVYRGDSWLLDSAGCMVYPDGNGMCRSRGKKIRYHGGRRAKVDFPSGCAAMYRRSMLDKIGLFDESFFMYNEDTDLGIRAQRAGYKCLYVPKAIVEHRGSKNTLKKLFYVERNRIKIMMKHFTWRQIVRSVPWTIWRYLHGGR